MEKSHPNTPDELIGKALRAFLEDIDGLAYSAPMTMFVLEASLKGARGKYDEFIERHCEKFDRDGRHMFSVPHRHVAEFEKVDHRLDQTYSAFAILPRTFLVSLISQYDAFLGRLARAIFRIQPEILNASERSLSFSELVGFASIEEAREQVIEEEIDALLRKSRTEQFEWLEKRLGTALRTELEIWPEFIEASQRRNLFVHSDGIVSKQYLTVCKREGVQSDGSIQLGSKMEVSLIYLERVRFILFELGVKLSQVVWRKLRKDDLKRADIALNEVCFQLLKRGDYRLAATLLDFAFIKAMRHHSRETTLMLLVNRANAYKLSGDQSKCDELISAEDWSATEAKFRLAEAVLRGDIALVKKCMSEIGPDGAVTQFDYRAWPLFRSIKDNEQFKTHFRQVFGEPLDVEEVVETKSLISADAVAPSIPPSAAEKEVSRRRTSRSTKRPDGGAKAKKAGRIPKAHRQ